MREDPTILHLIETNRHSKRDRHSKGIRSLRYQLYDNRVNRPIRYQTLQTVETL
mgnify:CR=1 FL=1